MVNAQTDRRIMNEDDYAEPTEFGTLRITKVRRHEEGFWVANVTLNGFTAEFHNRYGSWMTEIASGKRREAKRFVAEALGQRVGRKARKKSKEESAAPAGSAAAGPPASAAPKPRKNPKHRRQTTVNS
jgi:hypothetical protein